MQTLRAELTFEEWELRFHVEYPCLYMVPETQLTFLMPVAGHIVYIANPPFPYRSHPGPVDRALALGGVGWVGCLPFAGSARFLSVYLFVKL